MGIRESMAYRLLGVRATHEVTVCASVPEESLVGKRILITGGTSGIGMATARACIASGASVVVTGRGREKLDRAKRELGERASVQEWDQSCVDDVAAKVDEATELVGGALDHAFLCAGIYVQDGTEWNGSAFADTVRTNLLGVCAIARELVDRWSGRCQAGNSLVMAGSNRGLYPDTTPYGIMKAALHSFAQGIARDHAREGIRANVVAPGMTASAINGIAPEGNLARFDQKAYRVIRPEEIAEVVIFLLSDRSSCINGAIIPCDLGDSLR